MSYNPEKIEKKWQTYWEENQCFAAENNSKKPKYYVLDMFPYPSGSGLHVGHPLGYIASDIYSRYKRQKGYNVLHPMGYDAFGLPAEQYAIQKGIHPAESTRENIERYRSQLKMIGLSYDWSRELKTSDPNYYKWTQKIFILLFNHYYSTASDSAEPIEKLIREFENSGNVKSQASTTQEETFTAEEWKNYDEKTQSDILMNYRLAYRKVSYVNWCEELGTVLANDEVINGLSERGGYPVVKKPMIQWALRITAYADRLLEDMKSLEWSESLKIQQENWIGKSKGMRLQFEVDNQDESIEVFTTRPDTIYGVDFMVLAPEHELVLEISTDEQKDKIKEYISYAGALSDIERQKEKKVTGCFTGAYAIHPITEKKIPVYISEYVLKDYGTGAIMAVPSDDARDRRFAEKFDLEITEVIDRSEYPEAEIGDKKGIMINSDMLNGLKINKAIKKAMYEFEQKGYGKSETQYRLRDANFSRQRYWGEPYPVLYDENNIPHMMNADSLPVELPHLDDIKPVAGKSPLSNLDSWVNVYEGYTRETDTMPGYAGSSWYFLRYMDPHNEDEMFSGEAVNYWKDVDLYIGGTEHAVGHLMYSRFWHKFLFDLNYVPTKEPFLKLVNQGMIQGRSLFIEVLRSGDKVKLHVPINYADSDDKLTYTKFKELKKEDLRFEDIDIDKDIDWLEEDGVKYVNLIPEVEKMSKSKLNVVNPDEVIDEYGTDTFRLYEMFLGPIEDSKPWNTQGISGVSKFLNRFWALFFDENNNLIVDDSDPGKEEMKSLHTAIKKVNEDIEVLSFNTCISAFMILVNELRDQKSHNRHVLTEAVKLIAPFAPHLAEEIWSKLGNNNSIISVDYPTYEEKWLVEDEVEYPVCVNGKKRDEITVDKDSSKEELIEIAKNLDRIQKFIEGKEIRKVIVVPDRMINIVAG